MWFSQKSMHIIVCFLLCHGHEEKHVQVSFLEGKRPTDQIQVTPVVPVLVILDQTTASQDRRVA